MSGIPKTSMTRAERSGVLQFERLLLAIDKARLKDRDIDHTRVRKLVLDTLYETTHSDEERRGFAIALAEYLGVVADGFVPGPTLVTRSLKDGEFKDTDYKPLPNASDDINLSMRRMLGR